jgi:hypothetical protein
VARTTPEETPALQVRDGDDVMLNARYFRTFRDLAREAMRYKTSGNARRRDELMARAQEGRITADPSHSITNLAWQNAFRHVNGVYVELKVETALP